MIPDSKVEEVRAAADIVGVIGEFVQLVRAGKEYKAKCPFHEERTPSFYVVPEKDLFHCFGCGKSGDVFRFLMDHVGHDFPAAVKHVGSLSGIEVREVRRDDPKEEIYRIFWEMNDFAREWFRRNLLSDEGAAARAYLKERGVDDDVSERFSLGLAPAGGQNLRRAAAVHDYGDDRLIEGGLLGESADGGEPYDRFRDRVMFPIEVFGNRTVGFGGRILSTATKAAKYLNSPETPIFRKSEVLYGLVGARNAIRKAKSTLLVEGYMDVVSLAAHGFENVVAPLGTALTHEQAILLVRYSPQVIVLFDSDTAGLRATFRAADTLLEAGAHPLVATLPAGEDPDSLVRAQGSEELSKCVGDAVDVLDRKLQILQEKGFLESIDGRIKAKDRLLPTLRAVAAGDQSLRDVYFSQAAEHTRVRRSTLEEAVAEFRASPVQPQQETTKVRSLTEGDPAGRMGVVMNLLFVMSHRPHLADDLAAKVCASDLADDAHKAIFQVLLDNPGSRVPPDRLSSRATELFQAIIEDPRAPIFAEEDYQDLMTDCLERIEGAAEQRRQARYTRAIETALSEEEKWELARKKQAQRKRTEMPAQGF
ncbi:MAG: DNA primase [Gemmatimonadetes bacterium]|nr:DNA primase [Gemmatimonadota bacterium]